MSLFDTDIIEKKPLLGQVWNFQECTNPTYKGMIWKQSFQRNFSKFKLARLYTQIGGPDYCIEYPDIVSQFIDRMEITHNYGTKIKEYNYIMFLLLFAESFDEKWLSDYYTQTLTDRTLRTGGHVEVVRSFPNWETMMLKIRVISEIKQTIEVVFKKHN